MTGPWTSVILDLPASPWVGVWPMAVPLLATRAPSESWIRVGSKNLRPKSYLQYSRSSQDMTDACSMVCVYVRLGLRLNHDWDIVGWNQDWYWYWKWTETLCGIQYRRNQIDFLMYYRTQNTFSTESQYHSNKLHFLYDSWALNSSLTVHNSLSAHLSTTETIGHC